MEDVASAGGYSLLLADTDEDVAKERNYANVAVAENLAGVVVAPASSDIAHLARLVDLGIPLVAVDRRVDGLVVDSVTVDNFVAGYKATRHLLDHGYRHIGLISGPLSAMTAVERQRGYAAALHDAGADDDPELMIEGDFRVEGGRAGARLLRDRGLLDALVVGNNLMTVGAIETLGIDADRTLNRYGFVGFGELEWLGMLRPDIDAIIQPTYEIGRQCGELLLRRIEFPDAPVIDVVLQVELRLDSRTTRRSAAAKPAGETGTA
jgi:LacI family transcriptional regulator